MSHPRIEQIRSLRASMEAPGKQTERQCFVRPPDIIEALNRLGVFSLTVPEKFGGVQADALHSLSVIEELAHADSAVGWCSMIHMTSAMPGSFLPQRWARDVYGAQGKGGKGAARRSPILIVSA